MVLIYAKKVILSCFLHSNEAYWIYTCIEAFQGGDKIISIG